MPTESKNPGQIATPADCAALAAHEWDSGQVNPAQWKGRDTYLAVRAAALAGRLPAVPEREADNTPRRSSPAGVLSASAPTNPKDTAKAE